MSRKPIATFVLLLFFLSGATGLVYQVVWVRLFSQVFGATVLAISTVLAAFMGGLALGGFAGGRLASRWTNPLRVYAILEGALAVYAMLVPALLRAADPLYASIYSGGETSALLNAVRFLASAIVLLPPTILMGATLPILTRHAEGVVDEARRRVAVLYAVNTFGAVAGTLVASFALLPGIGLSATLMTGVGLNALVAILAFVFSRRGAFSGANEGLAALDAPDAGPVPEREMGSPEPAGTELPRGFVNGTVAVLGFSALAFEVLWTRTLALSLGTTAYAFAIVLAVFLIGIGSGSAFAGRLLRDGRRPLGLFVACPAVIGFLALVLVPLFDRLPELFVRLTARAGDSWVESLFVKFLLAGAPLVPPTFVSGAAFPLAVALDRGRASHRSVGDVYGANTLGAIVGSWAAGFVLLPALGLRAGVEVVAGLLILTTCVLLIVGLRSTAPGGAGHGDTGARPSARGRRLVAGALAVAAAAILVALPDWNLSLLTRGGFVLGHDLQRSGQTTLGADDSEIVLMEQGITTTVTVRRDEGELTMQMNGVTEASTAGDLSTQVSVASLPLLVHPDPRDVLVIGLGGGITAATAGRFPTVGSIECVEISRAVVRACALFADANRDILDDPRFRLIVGDGRNHLRLSPARYDVIVSLPSHVWNAGIGALMTSEFYAAARAKLRPGGLLCSWIQGYSVSPDVLRSVLAAVTRSFPSVTLWRGAWGDLLILAGDESFALDVPTLLEKGRDPEIGAVLRESGFPDLLSLLSLHLLAGDHVTAFVGGFPPNTDDRPYLEFEAPKLLYAETMGDLFGTLHGGAGGTERILRGAPRELLAEFPRMRRARALESEARLAFRDREGERGLRLLEEAFSLLPGAPSIRRTLAGVLNARAMNLASRGNVAEAGEILVKAIDVDPGFADSYGNLAVLYLDSGDASRAADAASAAVERNPRKPAHHVVLAKARIRRRELDGAREELERAIELDPRHEEAHVLLGDVWERLGDPARAESVWSAGLRARPASEELAAKLRKRRAPR